MATIKYETITPAIAREYLDKSFGNRRLNTDYVLSLGIALELGKWDPDISELVFDTTGALIDGHHRLNAVIQYGGSVKMLVKRGVAVSARGLIDTGRTKSLADLFKMFRPGVPYVSTRKAAIQACLNVLIPQARAIRTLDAYDGWAKHFNESFEALLEVCGGRDPSIAFKKAIVMGAFMLAHRADPIGTVDFFRKCVEGVGLNAGEPALTIRNLAMVGGKHAGTERTRMMKKLLSGIYAETHGQPWSKAAIREASVEFYKKPFLEKSAGKLIRMWTNEAHTEAA